MKAARINNPVGMRRRIVAAAYEAFSVGGFNATSMQELRDAAAVSSGAFSHHFPTKISLGLAVIRESIAEAVDEAWILPIVSASSAMAGIRCAFENVIAELERNGAVSGCPLNNFAVELSLQDAQLRQEMDRIFQSWRTAIEEKFEADAASGLMHQIEPRRLATLVVATYSGAMSMAKASQSAEPLRTSWQELRHHLLNAYK